LTASVTEKNVLLQALLKRATQRYAVCVRIHLQDFQDQQSYA